MAKGKCINIGKPCNLAISEEIQDADPANFVCKECGKPLVAVEGGDGTTPPPPTKKRLIIGICIAVVVAIGGIVWYINKDKDNKETTETTTVTDTVTTDTNTTDTNTTDTVTTDTNTIVSTETETPTPPVNPNYLNSYALPYGIYKGPAEDGVPNGLGGEVSVTKAYQLDLKAGGEMLDLKAGDMIVNCKFRNGKIVHGFHKRKNGQGRDFNIGI